MARSDVASMVNRSLGGRGNAVSVYSPTRRIRPTGRTANAGTAQRILSGGGPVEAPPVGTASFGGAPTPSVQLPGWAAALGGEPTGGGSRLDQLLAQSRAAPAPPDQPGGIRGAIGTVVNNPVGRGALTALNAFNYPRRVIQSSIKEVADSIYGDGASFDDWTQQIGDEGFDARDILPQTGVGFLDGLIGFGGDMLMDPLTFVGGAGLWSNLGGKSARAALAGEIIDVGATVGRLTATETAERAARWGISRFDDAARAELRAQLPGTSARILDRGYHFKVPLTQRFIPLPGTAPLDYVVGRSAARVRDVVTNSRVGQWMRYASTPGGMRDAVTTLTTRHARGGLSFAGAAEVVNWNNGRKIAERSFANRAARLVDEAVKGLGGGNGGRQAFRDVYRQEADGGTVGHEVFAAIREMGLKEGVHIPEFAGPYLPHYWLPEGRAWLNGDSDMAAQFKNLLFKEVDLDDPLAVAQQRKLIAGQTYRLGGQKVVDANGKTKWVGGHEFTLNTGSADEINGIFHKLVPDAKHDLIDTDAIAVSQRYVNDIAEKVGLLGGMKKLLGSKASLARTLNDDSFADRITDADIDALANRQVAPALKADWQRATSQLQQFRDDTRRGIKGVGGTAGAVVRDAVDGLSTVTASKKQIFDDAVRELGELEDQVGVGKYAERFNGDVEIKGRGPARRGSLEKEYGKVRKVFESERDALERKFTKAETKLATLRRDAALEARRLDAQGNVGATPIQDELRRVSAEQGATAADKEEIQAIIDRLDVTEAAQNAIDRRLGDRDFINVSVADDLSPKSPGSPINDPTPQAPVYVGPSPAEISTSHNAQRTQLLGADDPQVAEIAARYEIQVAAVERAFNNHWRAYGNHGEHVDNTRRLLGEGRQYEAGLKHEIGVLQGRPDQLENSMELSARLEAFQQGELPRLQRDFEDARRPLADAENTLAVQQKKLQEIRDEQMALARTMDARRTDPPASPLTPAGEKALRSQRRRIVMDRNKWSKTPEGVAHTAAGKALKKVTASLEKIGKRIEEITGKGGRFYVDADGVMQPKFTTREQWALNLMEERRATLVPAREAARARHDAAIETWSRLQRAGATASEVKAAQRDVSATFKAYKETQYAVTRANRELTKIKDVPDLGRVTAQSDELNRLLGEQAALKSQADDLGNQLTTSGATLRGFEDGIAGIDSQLTAQDTANRLTVEAPATPYGAQIAASHRAEAQRLEQVESQITLARRNWDDAPELPAAPSNLGRFEGQFENPTIRRALEVVGRDDGRRRLYDPVDEVVDVQNSAAAIRAASEPFTVPPVGSAAHTAVTQYSPASRGGVMGAVGRAQAVTSETQRVLERHIPELVESGGVPAEFGDELFRRRLDVDRLLDLHAANPSAHARAELETQASELGRLTEFALRYKQALDGGNEASPGLGSFILAQQLDDEAASLLRQIEIGNARLATPAGARAELGYSHGLARLNERAAQLTDNIENEIARGRAGGDWDQRAVRTWTDELERVQRQRDNAGAPANGLLDDTVDSHAAFAADDMRSLNDAEDIYNTGRFVDHRMQWPVRRRDELAAAIPHREAQVHSAKQGQRRLEEAVQRAQAAPDPPLQSGMVRLYRGDPVKPWSSPEAASAAREAGGLGWINQQPEMLARNRVQGRWFTTDRGLASSYPTNRGPTELNKVRYVDIPQAEYDRIKGLAGATPETRALSASPEAEVLLPDQYMGQVRDIPGQTVRYTPYNPAGYPGGVAEMSLAQAEANLANNQRVISMLEHDLVNKQVQASALDGSLDERIHILGREVADFDGAPDLAEIGAENTAIRQAAQTEQRALTPGELETIASNEARIDRLNRGQPLDAQTQASMRQELEQLTRVRDDFARLMDGDAAHASVARDPEPFLRGVAAGGGPMSERTAAMLADVVGPETAAAAKTWIHAIDESFAGRTEVAAEEFAPLLDDMISVFGDNELIDRMQQRAIASLDANGTISLDEMRDEFTGALIASATRQQGEAMRETLSMQNLLGSSFVDGPGGLQPRFAAAVADEPSHALLTARLRTQVIEAMQAKGYDPRNALVDPVADLRTRLGRVETMQRNVGSTVSATGMAGLPPVPAGHVRMWRGAAPGDTGVHVHEGPNAAARNRLLGRWVTQDIDYARRYMGREFEYLTEGEGMIPLPSEGNLSYVDIPRDVFERIKGLSDQPEDVIRSAGGAVPGGGIVGGGHENIQFEAILPEEYVPRFADAADDTIDMRLLRHNIAMQENRFGSGRMPADHAVWNMGDEEVMAYFAQVRGNLDPKLAQWVDSFGSNVPGPEQFAAKNDWQEVLFTGTAPAATRAQTRATLEAGSEAVAAERQGLLAQGEETLARLDPNRAARLAEQQRDLDARVARGEAGLTDEMTQTRAQIDRLQQQADHAERVYTERLNEVGMQLANVRRRVVEASVDHRAHEEYRQQLVRALDADPKADVPSMRAAIDDLKALTAYRRTLVGGAPPPSAAPPVPSGPRSLTPDEINAGWGDIHTPTAAEVQAVAKMNADARAAGVTDWDWFAPHAVGSNPNRLGPVQLPKGTAAPPGYKRVDDTLGPQKLANDLGIGGHVSTSGGVANPLGAGRDLWALGYRDAADLGGRSPADIINNRIPFQPAAAAPTPPVAATVDEIAELDAIDAQLVAYAADVKKITNDAQSADALYKGMRHAEANAEVFAKVNKALMADGMRIHMRGISHETPEGWAVDNALATAIENVTKVVETADFWKWLDKYTAFFKTYATAKPGFHVRNAISATFMNLVDGVRLRDMYQGTRLWLQYERDPQFFLKRGVDPRIRGAFDAVFGSGAGGRYTEARLGVNLQAGSKMYRRLMDNKLTRWNQRLGSRVEGSARLSMALNSMYRGATPEQAMRRIAKFHFDYTEMSDLDRMARRLIPFWTFMSRNLPLQLEQMLTNPRMYLQYQSLVRNFGQPMDPATPGYWLSAGAFTVDAHAQTRESPWYIAPDLPHLQVTEPMDALMRGEWDKALLSDVNPLLLAPVEAGVIGHKVFSQASLEGYEETSRWNPFVPLFNLISTATPFNPTAQGASGDTVVAKGAAHMARSLLPPWEFAERLLDPTGKRAGRTDETIARAFGVPVRQLNDALREGERRSQYYDRRESHETQAELARM